MTEDDTKILIPEEIKTITTDDRGRAYVGSDYKNSDVKIAILEVEENEDDE